MAHGVECELLPSEVPTCTGGIPPLEDISLAF